MSKQVTIVMTKEQYIEFLISTPLNYTCTHLADHLSGVSHDSITDFLKSQRLTAESVWMCAKALINDAEESFLIVDDSVQEKPYAQAIELVYPHYSGNKHAVVRGIDIVNLVHNSGYGEYYPVDYRIYAPEYERATKNDLFLAMLKEDFEVRSIRAKYILFDSWYASATNLKYIHRQGRIFVTVHGVGKMGNVPSAEAFAAFAYGASCGPEGLSGAVRCTPTSEPPLAATAAAAAATFTIACTTPPMMPGTTGTRLATCILWWYSIVASTLRRVLL